MATLSSPTLERLLRDVRIMLNQPRPENSRWSDTELGEYINDAIQKYFLVINENAEGQFDKVTFLDLVQNVETVALPSDCFTIKVLYMVQNTEYVPLAYRNNVNRTISTQGSLGGNTNFLPEYYLRANNIVLYPQPGFSQTGGLRLEYTSFPETLLMGADVMTAGISPVFKELVVMYAVYKAKLKDDLVNGSNTRAGAEQLLSSLYDNFKHQVVERSKYPQFIQPWNP